jgi:putative two-component system response regulator
MDNALREKKILIVDDTKANIDILADALKPLYKINVALNGEAAIDLAERVRPDLVLLDIMMPGMDGYTVCRSLKNTESTQDIPIIFLTALDQVDAKSRGFELGAVDYVTKPFEPVEVKARVRTHLMLKTAMESLQQQNEILEEKVSERTRELLVTRDVTIQSLSSLAETRDNETGGHIRRTQRYVELLADRLASHPDFSETLTGSTRDLFAKSAPLHDIGKVGVPDRILLKAGKLTDEEFEIMKLHTVYGEQALLRAEKDLGTNSFLTHARNFAACHHERWDGKGYPQGRKENAIPVEGRLMAVADVYDALISRRIYKPIMPHSKAVGVIAEGKETQFDPRIVEAFLSLQEEFRAAALQLADSEEQTAALGM